MSESNKLPVFLLREAKLSYRGERKSGPSRIIQPKDVDALFRERLVSEVVEVFIVLALNAKSNVIGWHEVARGGVSSCAVSPADCFRFAIMAAATSVVFLHNHPSGEPSPSADDVAMTERLRRGAALLGLRVLDHVIIAEGGFFSFLDAGLLEVKGREAL